MRYIRLIIFVLILAASYAAQLVFDQRSLSVLWAIPLGSASVLGDFVPGINGLNRLSPDELLVFGTFVVLISSIGFGLISPRWLPSFRLEGSTEPSNDSHHLPIQLRGEVTAPSTFTRDLGLGITILALALVIIVTAQVSSFGLDTVALQSTWLSGLVLYLIGSILLGRGQYGNHRIRHEKSKAQILTATGNQLVEIRPASGWPMLLLILFGATILYLWQLWLMPARLDNVVAEIGLQSLAILRGEAVTLFHPGITGLPMLAYVPPALAIQLTGDPLFGVRLVGVGTGLVMIVGTWLLSCELFRRVPRYGEFGTLIEDDGRWMALLAALVVAFGHVTLHFSRIPVFLGPVAWGTLGLWALLRGLRCQNLYLLALSGLMIGLAGVLNAGGLFFLLITPIWWIGVWLLQRHWLYSDHGVRAQGFMLWLGGLTIVLLPFLGVWSRLPQAFTAYLQNDLLLQSVSEERNQALFLSRGADYLFLDNLRLTLFTFNIYPNNGPLVDLAGPFLSTWLAPLLFLGLGALVLNLDRLLGWLLLVSMVTGVIFAAISLNVPFWLRLLSILPLVAIVIAFTIDRIRVTLMETVGVWLEQTTVYLALGLIAWASLYGWLDYYNYALRQEALSSHIGRAIQSMGPDQTAVLFFDLSAMGHSESAPSQPADRLAADVTLANQASSNPVSLNQAPLNQAPLNNDSSSLPLNEPLLNQDSLLTQNGLNLTVIEFLSSDINGPKSREEIGIGPQPENPQSGNQWPAKEQLPERSRILLQPDNRLWIEEIKERYGEGKLTPVRNLRGDPVLYIYDIW